MTALANVLGKPAKPRPFAAFVTDDDSREAVVRATAELGIANPAVNTGNIAEAIRRLNNAATPQLLLVDLSGSPDPMADVGALADVCDEGTRVIAVGDVNDIALYRALLGFGVHDYLVKPVDAASLAVSLGRARDGQQAVAEPAAPTVGRIVAVVGARGGVGATTIAVNVAWMLAQEERKRVALVDSTCSSAVAG